MAEKVRDYKRLASEIVTEVGGVENIALATRCATRLRLTLREPRPDAKEKVSTLRGVISVIERGGQFQVVIGTHVGEVYDALREILPEDNASKNAAPPKESLLNRVIYTMSSVITPFIYILAAAGLLQGILILLTKAWPAVASTGTFTVMNFISWTPFIFLPVFVAVTSAAYFRCNTFIAMACCASLLNPDWMAISARIIDGEQFSFLTIPLEPTSYTAAVLPPIILVAIMSRLERFLEQVLPGVLKAFLTPMLCMAIMVPATFVVIGPLTTFGTNLVASGYNWMMQVTPMVTSALVGGFWQVPVIFGIHHGITPMVIANFANFGEDSFQAFQSIAVVGQMGAAFGVALITRNKEIRNVGLSAGITAIFGITEPAIYGVTLRLKKPFICGCVGGAIGSIVASFFHAKYFVYAGLPGILTVLNSLSDKEPSAFIGTILGCGISLIASIILVYMVRFKDIPSEREA